MPIGGANSLSAVGQAMARQMMGGGAAAAGGGAAQSGMATTAAGSDGSDIPPALRAQFATLDPETQRRIEHEAEQEVLIHVRWLIADQ